MSYTRLVAASAAIAISAAVFLVVASPALATGPAASIALDSIGHVDFADLDLTSVAGTKALRSRIDSAVRTACGGISARDYDEEISCRDRAWLKAEPQIASATQRARDIAAIGTPTIANGVPAKK